MNVYTSRLIDMARRGTWHSSLVMMGKTIEAFQKALVPPDCESGHVPDYYTLELCRALRALHRFP